MIIPDVNVLIHAYNIASPVHEESKVWWRKTMDDGTPVGLPWVSALGFIRIMTNRGPGGPAMAVATAVGHVKQWLRRPAVRILHPGEHHAEILFSLLEIAGTGGNLTTDAHLAALAIEYHGELVSCDTDFTRFPGLRWRKPF